jgi:hypothetical protein
MEWVDGLYEEQVYQEKQLIMSPQFASLSLAAPVLAAGR